MNETINYGSLNIHQKINWKNQTGVCADRWKWHSPNSFRLTLSGGTMCKLTNTVKANPWYWSWYYIP